MYPGNRRDRRNEDQYNNDGSYEGYNANQQPEFPQYNQDNYQQPGGYNNYPMPGEDGYASFPGAQNDQYQDPNQYNDETYSRGLGGGNNQNGGGYNQYPQADYPQDNYDQNNYSRNTGNQGNNPQSNYPQNNYQQNDYPQNNYHQNDYPQSNYHQNDFPQNNYQDNGYNQNQNYPEGHSNQNQSYPGSRSNQNQQQNGGGGYNATQFNELFPPSIETYSSPADWGVAPAINLPVPTVVYDNINYSDMQFPEYHSSGNQNYNGQYNQPQGGNNQAYQSAPQGIQHQPTNASISNCQGRKRALLIGVNYTGTKYKLRGCINDVHRMKKFIMDHFQFKESDMVILTDDQTNPNRIPTRQNILRAMKWLVSGAQRNDSFFFHYSGHGSRVEDANGDELDGFDETICPVDFEKNGQIIDDDMNAIMVRPLPPGARLTAVYDCCHSATALDLPYMYGASGKLKNNKALNIAGNEVKDAGASYMKGDIQGALGGLTQSFKTLMSGDSKLERARKEKSSMGDVIMFSGCKDTQTSADAKEDLNFTGAMSWSLTNSLYAKPHQTYIELLNDIRQRLAGKYTQIPQLSTGRLMDMNTIFIM
ncbi:Metacaspase-1 [Smittium mucronatum]|uniref:Metacaspase-1 n=1 Tax=Smittium mucronatum TaxID=133383 RepID=A0A1R0H193_9FUNG|nr:Metacaspase-1 [Smittium mucronatum]